MWATPAGLLIANEIPDPPEAGTPFGANGFNLSVHDPLSGRQIAHTSIPGYTSLIDGDVMWLFGQDDADVWHFQRYSLPGLTPTLELPPVTVAPDQEIGFATATDGVTDVALLHAPGSLTAWDARTGSRLGGPVDVDGDFAGMTWARDGHPGQAVVATPGHLELWDVPAGRRLGSTALVVQNYRSVVADRDTLVAITPEGSLEVRRLPDMEPVGPPIFTPGTSALIGFDPEGRLVAVTGFPDGQEIVLWDLERRTEAGRIQPARVLGTTVAGGALTTQGGSGNLPEVIPLRAGDWQAHLCHLLPGEPSAGAVALLPAGADRSSPCGRPS